MKRQFVKRQKLEPKEDKCKVCEGTEFINAVSASEANPNRPYLKCADLDCKKFLRWTDEGGPFIKKSTFQPVDVVPSLPLYDHPVHIAFPHQNVDEDIMIFIKEKLAQISEAGVKNEGLLRNLTRMVEVVEKNSVRESIPNPFLSDHLFSPARHTS